MNRKLLITGSLLGVLGIALGAFAAHGLKELVSADSIKSFETAVRYQMYHAILLLILGVTDVLSEKSKSAMFYLVIIGLILFSGSIYALATNNLSSFDFKSIGFVTPIGGLFLIGAWSFMMFCFIKYRRNL